MHNREKLNQEALAAQPTLTSEDALWLHTLRCGDIDDNWISEANALIPEASIDLSEYYHPSNEEAVLNARQLFFGNLLGWKNANHPFHDTYTKLASHSRFLMPVNTVIGTMRVLVEHGIDTSVAQDFRVLTLSPETVQTKIKGIEEQGIDREVIRHAPSLLSYDITTLQEKVQLLNACGIKNSSLTKSPNLLTFSISLLKEKVEILCNYGIDIRTVNEQPSILTFSTDSIREKLDFIMSKGLEPKIINKAPSIIGYTNEAIEKRIVILQASGITLKAISKAPTILKFSPDSVKEKFVTLSELGVNTGIVNRQPTILQLSTEYISRRMNSLHHAARALRWEGSVVELVNIFPIILTLSDEKLKVHARLFMKQGTPDTSEREVARQMVQSVETLFIASLQGKSMYTIAETMKANQRKHYIEEQIRTDRQKFIAMFGEKSLKAYEKYVSRGTQPSTP